MLAFRVRGRRGLIPAQLLKNTLNDFYVFKTIISRLSRYIS